MNEKVCELKDRLRQALEIRDKKAVDLATNLNIPKPAISQYLKGKSQRMDSKRLHDICKYPDVSEPWMLGYDVPMERTTEQKNDTIADVVVRMRTDADFFNVVSIAMELPKDNLIAIRNLLATFSQDSQDQVE